MKEIIERILREEGLLPSDGPAVFSAMGKILYETAQQTKVNEPYATESIQELERFSSMVDDYDYFLQMHPY